MFCYLEQYVDRFMENQRRCNRGQGTLEFVGGGFISYSLVALLLVVIPNPVSEGAYRLLEMLVYGL